MVSVECTAGPPFRAHSSAAGRAGSWQQSGDSLLRRKPPCPAPAKIKNPPWGQSQSNDWHLQTYKSLAPSLPFSATVKSTSTIEASVKLAEAFVENGPQFESVPPCFLHAPTRASLINFLHASLQFRVCSGKSGLWLYYLQSCIKPRHVSPWPTGKFLRKWLENYNQVWGGWQVNSSSWEAAETADDRGAGCKNCPSRARFQSLRKMNWQLVASGMSDPDS